MKYLAPLLTLALLIAITSLAQASEEKETARIWLDLDGDKLADRVTIVDSGVFGENYVLRVKLNDRGQILEARNVIPSPSSEGIWSVNPQYTLEKAGSGSFVLQLYAGDDDAYRGTQTYRYSLALRKGELVVLSFLSIDRHLSVGDPNRTLNLNYRFLDGKILGKIDSWHGEFHNRQGASEALPRRCRGPQPLSSWDRTQAPVCARDAALRLEKRLDDLTQN